MLLRHNGSDATALERLGRRTGRSVGLEKQPKDPQVRLLPLLFDDPDRFRPRRAAESKKARITPGLFLSMSCLTRVVSGRFQGSPLANLSQALSKLARKVVGATGLNQRPLGPEPSRNTQIS